MMSNSRVHVDSVSGVVYFTPVHKDDEGSYNCTAFNDVGAASSSNQLRVYGTIDTVTVSVLTLIFECLLVLVGQVVLHGCHWILVNSLVNSQAVNTGV